MLSVNTHKPWKRLLSLLMAGLLGTACLVPPGGLNSASAADDTKKDAASAPAAQPQKAASAPAPGSSPSSNRKLIQAADTEPYYADVLKGWLDKGAKPAEAPITIAGANPAAVSSGADIRPGSYEGKDNVLVWNGSSNGYVEYKVDVPADGLYEMQVSYRPVTGKGLRRPIVWNMMLDGKRPFRESSSITLYRQWRDARPIKKDQDGDDIRPKSEEITSWTVQPLFDSGGAYAEPLQWFLTKGTHTLRLEGYEPVAIESIRLQAPQKLKPYSEVAGTYPASKPVQAGSLTIQAEEPAIKSDSAIQMVSDSDQRTVPQANGYITFNTIGGKKWWNQNQALTWNFEVPESGKYKLGMRALQNFISQKASYRTIRIDGKVPFQELLTYRFGYDTAWAGIEVADPSGKPYEFYLEKGKHSLTMTVTHAPYKPMILGIEQLTDLLETVVQDLKSLTGGVDDKNRTWKIQQDLPDLPKRLNDAAAVLMKLAEQTEKANGRTDNISQGFISSAQDIQKLLSKVDDIPYHGDQIASIQTKVSGFIEQLIQQPLQLDEIYVAPVEKKFPDMTASFPAKVKGMIMNFFYTFRTKDSLGKMKDTELNVWVHRGRDYVTQLQELADAQFTPETGIKVKVNLLPNTQLLVLSNAAGIQPDVALGLSQDLPVDYAIRNSVLDLSKFPDFKDIYNRYSPGSWLPFYYNKGYYAIPETQSFQVLFYRKDILSRMGLSLPDTWQDVYDMLPTLQQNYMNFYVNPKEYMMFFYQNQADFFNKEGSKTMLDSPESFKAFRQWTDMFNIYALEREVPSFYQHFRKGEMPIGISDYNMYIQLSAAAPELNGRWGIAPIPGTKQPDGTVARWAGGGQSSGVIFKASKKQQEAWQFLKWWNSADVQERYGSDLEAFNGISFRWNTSNLEAFTKLPWKREDANVILQQWAWYKDMPNLPGGYFVPREISNAWNRTVVDGMNYRNSLELAQMEINRELRRKQQEFGFVDADGNSIKTMDLPVVNKPWEGVKPYVK
ncbi:extracellular solute-binding protein [Paenibacillus filicis]|uniref:Extracellular solute-binding protein n=1 Tax=Paenibacillus gyeongsangnamensis TaxID=3388067 RepID=A0ABT4QFE2_9BACL|nr:extracellular solute-binding protein [Paenibacillus filicis]MCZ8515598.1 extracellular solute-binding protein [Paenibacillus filicis]